MICMKVFKLSKHLWRSKLQHVSSGWGACGGPNDGFHGFYHGLRRSAMRMRVGMTVPSVWTATSALSY